MELPDVELFYDQIRERIRSEREKQKVTLETLGKKLGISKAGVNNLEQGRSKPSLYQLLLIADLLNLHYTDLIPFGAKEDARKKREGVDSEKGKIELDDMVSDKKLDPSEQTYVTDFLNRLYNK